MKTMRINSLTFPKEINGGYRAHYRTFDDERKAQNAAQGLASIGWSTLIVANQKNKFKIYLG